MPGFVPCKELFREKDPQFSLEYSGQKSLRQYKHNSSSMWTTPQVNVMFGKAMLSFEKSLTLQPSPPRPPHPVPFPAQYNVDRSKKLWLDGFNTVRGVEGGSGEVDC